MSLSRISNDSRSDRVRRPSLGPPSPASTGSSPYTTSLPGSRLSIDTDPARLKQTSLDYGDRRESMNNGCMFFDSPTSSEVHQSYHPYANPDLVISRTPESYKPSVPLPVSREIVSGESTGTVTESSIPSLGSTGATTLTPDSSTASVDPSSTVLGREISKPITLAGHDLQRDDKISSDSCPPNVHKFPGWTEKTAPSFGLISLEEAQARRARSATQPASAGRPSHVSLDGESIPPVPGPEVHGTQLPHDSGNQKSRARSSSAGGKAKIALQSVIGAQPRSPRSETLPGALTHVGPAPAKSLKQKRSGFLRLLIGSKAQEREDQTPPPVPMLPDWTSRGLQQTVSRTPGVRRVPVPKTVTVFGNVEGKPENDDICASPTELVPSPKRIRPPLSIGTDHAHLPPILAISESPEIQTVTVDTHQQHWQIANASRSAPANIHNFPPSIPPLQLRPISALFSSHFEGHLSKDESRPSLETDTSTLRSPSCYSPATPHSIGLFNNEKVRKASTDNYDQSAVIKALQLQLASAELARQKQVQELEGQVSDLKAQLDELNTAVNSDSCEVCGRGLHLNNGHDRIQGGIAQQTKTSIAHRPKARSSTRFGSTVE